MAEKIALTWLGGGLNGAIGVGYWKYIKNAWSGWKDVSFMSLLSVSTLNGLAAEGNGIDEL